MQCFQKIGLDWMDGHLLVDVVEVCLAPQNGAQFHGGRLEVGDGRLAIQL
jgi:hypothetical protein